MKACLKTAVPHTGWRDKGKRMERVTVTDEFLVSALGRSESEMHFLFLCLLFSPEDKVEIADAEVTQSIPLSRKGLRGDALSVDERD